MAWNSVAQNAKSFVMKNKVKLTVADDTDTFIKANPDKITRYTKSGKKLDK